MSTDPAAPTPGPTHAAPAAHAPAARPAGPRKLSIWRYILLGQSKADELTVVHHSTLFYWWPVWFFGYILAAVSYFGDMHMALVPAGTEAVSKRAVVLEDGKSVTRDVLVLPEGKTLPTKRDAEGNEAILQPTYYMAQHRMWGTFFVAILLLVTIITNITMRGLWSFLVLIFLVMLALLITAGGWWHNIIPQTGRLAVHINMGGYILLSSVLLLFWLVNLFIFDRQTYMIFTPGQVRLRLEIGGGETVYDATGMVVQKQRGDLFRHWVLGFGSGDLIIRPVGVSEPLELTNVLHAGRVVKAIEQMIKEKVVVTDHVKG